MRVQGREYGGSVENLPPPSHPKTKTKTTEAQAPNIFESWAWQDSSSCTNSSPSSLCFFVSSHWFLLASTHCRFALGGRIVYFSPSSLSLTLSNYLHTYIMLSTPSAFSSRPFKSQPSFLPPLRLSSLNSTTTAHGPFPEKLPACVLLPLPHPTISLTPTFSLPPKLYNNRSWCFFKSRTIFL